MTAHWQRLWFDDDGGHRKRFENLETEPEIKNGKNKKKYGEILRDVEILASDGARRRNLLKNKRKEKAGTTDIEGDGERGKKEEHWGEESVASEGSRQEGRKLGRSEGKQVGRYVGRKEGWVKGQEKTERVVRCPGPGGRGCGGNSGCVWAHTQRGNVLRAPKWRGCSIPNIRPAFTYETEGPRDHCILGSLVGRNGRDRHTRRWSEGLRAQRNNHGWHVYMEFYTVNHVYGTAFGWESRVLMITCSQSLFCLWCGSRYILHTDQELWPRKSKGSWKSFKDWTLGYRN